MNDRKLFEYKIGADIDSPLGLIDISGELGVQSLPVQAFLYKRYLCVLQNDRARAITWSEARPDLLAIQYHQHATEFRSIETGSEVSARY